MTIRTFIAVIARDLTLARRRPLDAFLPIVFFLVSGSLFPLGVGPDPTILREIAPGIVWVCALLSALVSLGAMYGTDYSDGSLEQMLLSRQSPLILAAAKATAHWFMTGVPLILVAPVFGMLFDMSTDSIAVLAWGLVLGTPVLSLVGGVGAALTLGLRNGAMLILLLVLPLCMPVLIFGAGAVTAFEAGLSASGNFSLLGATLLLALLGAPLATAAALRISV